MTPSITLTLMSELLGSQTTQEARPVVGEGQTPTLSPATPPVPASEPQAPRRWRTLRTPDGQRPSPRQAQRDARQYAEAWYQALRDWQAVSRGEVVPRDLSPRRSNPRQMTPVVGNWGSGGVGLWTTQVWTPLGWVAQSTLSRLCNADPLLSHVRAGGGLASLSQEGGGWHQHKADALAYAVAVLQLAVSLGDGRAVDALHTVKTQVD